MGVREATVIFTINISVILDYNKSIVPFKFKKPIF